MEAQAEVWWRVEYPKHSLRSASKQRLIRELSSPQPSRPPHYGISVRYSSSSQSITKRTISSTETLQYHHQRKVWLYEKRQIRAKYEYRTSVSGGGGREWGTVSKRYAGHSIEENWGRKTTEKHYEYVKIEGGIRKGFKWGKTTLGNTTAVWTEEVNESVGGNTLSTQSALIPKVPSPYSPPPPSPPYPSPSRLWDSAPPNTDFDCDATTELSHRDTPTIVDQKAVKENAAAAGQLELLWKREYEAVADAITRLEALHKQYPICGLETAPLLAELSAFRLESHPTLPCLISQLTQLRDLQDSIESHREILMGRLCGVRLMAIEGGEAGGEAGAEGEVAERWERFLDSKFEDDCDYLSRGALPRSCLDFLPSFLAPPSPPTPSTPPNIPIFLLTLKSYAIASPLSTLPLICQLLGINDDWNIPYFLGMFIVRIREEFKRLRKESKEAPLGDTLRLVLALFWREKDVCEQVALGLKPENMRLDEFTQAKITVKSLFFNAVFGLTSGFQLKSYLSPEEIPLISAEKAETDHCLHLLHSYSVSEATFLSSLVFAYRTRELAHSRFLSETLESPLFSPYPPSPPSPPCPTLSPQAFRKLLSHLDPSLSLQQTETILSAASQRSLSPFHISKPACISVLLTYPIGVYQSSAYSNR